jgi:hypothetical protein
MSVYGGSIFKRTVVGILACSIKMAGSKPKLKVRTLDEMFKKISESSEIDLEQLAHTSENSPALSLSETDSRPFMYLLVNLNI